jgi:hypothetical protein
MHDLFTITNLPFDPPEPSETEYSDALREISYRIEQIDSEISSGDSSHTLQRNFLKPLLINEDSALNIPLYERYKSEKYNKVKETLTATIRTLSRMTLTEVALESYSKKTNLSIASVRKIFLSEGFEIVNLVRVYLVFPDGMTDLENELTKLRSFHSKKAEFRDLQKINNLYDFVAYLSGDINLSRSMENSYFIDLISILTEYIDKSKTQQSPGATILSIATFASKSIFNCAENKYKYDNFIKYNSPEMAEIIRQIQSHPPCTLRSCDVAEGFISQIEQIFGENYALSLYNEIAGFYATGSEPYIPQIIRYHIRCGFCFTNISYATTIERDEAEYCSNCRKPLYRECPTCASKVLYILPVCHSCSFDFILALRFDDYIETAYESLRNYDVATARSFLEKARSANPNEREKIKQLSEEIADATEKIEKPIRELELLIVEKKYVTASGQLHTIPIEKVPEFSAKIDAVMTGVNLQYDSSINLSASEKANKCIEILEICVDFQQAIDFLLNTPPLSVLQIYEPIVDDIAGTINISWDTSKELGVTYRIVRKQGQISPQNILDGKTITTGSTKNVFSDNQILGGVYYSYAIFAERMGVCSEHKCITAIVFTMVSDVRAKLVDRSVDISWKKPNGCDSIRLLRKVDGVEATLVEKIKSDSFTDYNLVYGKSYIYSVVANYSGFPSSKPVVSSSICPREKIDDFAITITHKSASKYHVAWTMSRSDIEMSIYDNRIELVKVPSERLYVEIELSPENLYQINATATSGSLSVTSKNSETINTYNSVQIDKNKSSMAEKLIPGTTDSHQINIKLKLIEPLPPNTKKFKYSISSVSCAKYSEIKTETILCSVYNTNNFVPINWTANAENSFSITFYTIYDVGGSEVVSAPVVWNIERAIEARISWKISKSSVIGLKRKLLIEIESNRTFSKIPRLILCTSDSDRLRSYTDKSAIILLDVPETIIPAPVRNYTFEYKINNFPSGKKIFLFVEEKPENSAFSIIQKN